MTSEPMFPLPLSAHRTFVRVVEIDLDLGTWGLEGACRGCGWSSDAPRAFYASAWEDCYRHCRDEAERQETGWYGQLFDRLPVPGEDF